MTFLTIKNFWIFFTYFLSNGFFWCSIMVEHKKATKNGFKMYQNKHFPFTQLLKISFLFFHIFNLVTCTIATNFNFLFDVYILNAILWVWLDGNFYGVKKYENIFKIICGFNGNFFRCLFITAMIFLDLKIF